jgi:hypothetical protein
MPEVERTIVLGMSPETATLVKEAITYEGGVLDICTESAAAKLDAVVKELDTQLALPRKVKV